MNLIIENGGYPTVIVDGNPVPAYEFWAENKLVIQAKKLILAENVDGMVGLLSAKTSLTLKIVGMCKEMKWETPLNHPKVIKAIEDFELKKETKEKMRFAWKRPASTTSADVCAGKKEGGKNRN